MTSLSIGLSLGQYVVSSVPDNQGLVAIATPAQTAAITGRRALPHEFINASSDPTLTWVDDWQSTTGVAEADAAGRMSGWTGFFGNAFTNATPANQLRVTTSDASLGNLKTVGMLSADQGWAASTVNLPAPTLAAPILILAVARATAHTSTRCLFGSGAGTLRLEQNSTTPSLRPNNGSAGTAITAGALNTWYGLEILLTGNNTSGRWRWGATDQAAQNFGAGNPGNLVLGAISAAAGTTHWQGDIAAFCVLTGGDLSGPSLTSWRAWVTSLGATP